VQRIDWACGKQREAREMRKQFNATSNTYVRACKSPDSQENFPQELCKWEKVAQYSLDLHLLTLSPSSIRGSRCSN
jgi:hypothetical protein